MDKISRLIVYIGLLLFALPVWAQQPDAREVLDRTADAFKKAGSVRAAFTVQTSEGTSAGIIRLKGEKFLLETDGSTTWFDGHTQWTYLESSDEVNVSEPTAEELQSINPYAWLSVYKQGFVPKLDEAENAKLKSLYKVVLAAEDLKQDLLCIVLYVTKDTYCPKLIGMSQRGGETVVIVINSYQEGESYPDALFVFDKKAHPSAEVIDLR